MMGCTAEGQRQQGASRDAMEIVRRAGSGQVDVAKFVGVQPVLPLRQQQLNRQQQQRELSPQKNLERLPPCLRAQLRRGQRDKQNVLFDNGEGKTMSVSFAREVVFVRRPLRHVDINPTSKAHSIRRALQHASSTIYNQHTGAPPLGSSERGFWI